MLEQYWGKAEVVGRKVAMETSQSDRNGRLYYIGQEYC
jgi:hypothetical protein